MQHEFALLAIVPPSKRLLLQRTPRTTPRSLRSPSRAIHRSAHTYNPRLPPTRLQQALQLIAAPIIPSSMPITFIFGKPGDKSTKNYIPGRKTHGKSGSALSPNGAQPAFLFSRSKYPTRPPALAARWTRPDSLFSRSGQTLSSRTLLFLERTQEGKQKKGQKHIQ